MVHNVLYWITFWIFHTIIRLFVSTKDIQGLEHLKDIRGPLIIASNHRGRIDGIWIWYYLARMNRNRIVHMRIITGAVFFTKPIVGWYLRQMRCFPVVSGQGLQVVDPMVDVLNDDGIVTIFPEGKMQKTVNGRGEAKRGVGYLIWKSEARVLPIYINYHQKWKNLPFYTMTFNVGKITSYDTIKSEDKLQKVADDVLESIYQLDKK
jgi:1-acyl-sn-glycerol-3-phosphate acyltransferase